MVAKISLHQQARYVIAGGFNTACSFGMYSLGIYLGLQVWLAALFSLIFGICLSFFLQSRYVFRVGEAGRFLPFIASWALIYFLNISCIEILALYFNLYVSGLLASGPTFAFSYFINKKIFSVRQR